MSRPFSIPVTPDWQGLLRTIRREATPSRTHVIELFLDFEVQEEIAKRFGLLDGLDRSDPFFNYRREIAIQSFLGYDYVRCGMEGLDMPLNYDEAEDTAALQRAGGRSYVNEHRGPVTTWEEFEKYPWPDPEKATTRGLEWYSENLPENMCIVGSGGIAHYAEHLTWLMGYETFCTALFEQRDLVEAIAQRLIDQYRVVIRRVLEFDRVKMIWGSDDMGYRGGPIMSPDDMRALVLPGHKLMAEASHAAGRPYLLHSCGNLALIMEDLIKDVGIDGKHSFEDTIESVIDFKRVYGSRTAALGGIDMDFLCRASEAEVRARVRRTLDACMDGGGYCLGTGNTVANYVPVDNYLAMVDEGRRFTG